MTTETKAGEGTMVKIIRAALQVDRAEAKASAEAARTAHPGESNAELAARMFRKASWQGALVGAVSGLPANIAAAAPAAILDAAAVLRLEINMAARVAALYDPRFLDAGEGPWELLVPIFGVNVVSQALREAGVVAAGQVTRAAVRALLRKEGAAVLVRATAKAFGVKVTQRAIAAKTVPLVGALVGGSWNLGEIRFVGRRVVDYFEADAGAPMPAAA